MTNNPSLDHIKKSVLKSTRTIDPSEGQTLDQIEASTGGVDDALLKDDRLYVETLAQDGTKQQRVTSIDSISKYTINEMNTNLDAAEIVESSLPADLLQIRRDNSGTLETKAIDVNALSNDISKYTINEMNTNLDATEVVQNVLGTDCIYVRRNNNGTLETKTFISDTFANYVISKIDSGSTGGETIEEISDYTINQIKTNLDAAELITDPVDTDIVYLRRDNNGTLETKSMTSGTFADYVVSKVDSGSSGNTNLNNPLTRFFQISGSTDTFNVDLTPFINYTKLHLKFPKARNFKDITINITGLKDRVIPLQSITMSGLDEDTDFLPIAKRGRITFTLDSADYEFPESIYHFGGFKNGEMFEYAVGSMAERIFLDIKYIQVSSNSDNIYMYAMKDAIYATYTILNIDSELVTLDNKHGVYYVFNNSTTLIFKMQTNVSSINTSPTFLIYQKLSSTSDSLTLIDSLYMSAHIYQHLGNKYPLILGTQICIIDGILINCLQHDINQPVKTNLVNTNMFVCPDTFVAPLSDWGLFEVFVLGKYLNIQINL